ncbi:LppU/SCO3897 family protein [Streptomyces sp. enrichment culture]|uniref:LppU/SCO3897 family protein n=1 Tax=Streptomyces sp. enrichment culture TaxID=1795815 RepID=UPI003F55679E
MSTPPPQGQNPFAQGQNPYAQPQGSPTQAPFPPQAAAPVPPQPQSRRSKFKIIKFAVIGVAALTAIIGGYLGSRDDADQAKVGDCLKAASSSTDRMEVVDCTSSEAEAKVLKKVDGHFTSFTAETECRKVKGATGFYAETGDGDEFLLCTSEV